MISTDSTSNVLNVSCITAVKAVFNLLSWLVLTSKSLLRSGQTTEKTVNLSFHHPAAGMTGLAADAQLSSFWLSPNI